MQSYIGAAHITVRSKERVINECYINSGEVTAPNTSGAKSLTAHRRSIPFRLKVGLTGFVAALMNPAVYCRSRYERGVCLHSCSSLDWQNHFMVAEIIIRVHPL